MTKTLFIDADTILYSSAAKEEINKCFVTNKTTGNSRMFESKTAFNNWYEKNQRYAKDEYSFSVEKEVIGTEVNVKHSIRSKIEHIVEAASSYGFKDYKVCIQGHGNYRKDYTSQFVDYKGQRTQKPLLYEAAFNYAKTKYKDKCVVTNGEETDDFICKTAWATWKGGTDLSDCDTMFAYVDKDIVQNSPGAMLNYYQLESGPFINTEQMQYKGFWKSVLVGDKADNIPGIVKLSDETLHKYGIRKSKDNACGPAAAARILSVVESESECASKVLEAYSLAWPEDYMERLQDMCFFLWLRRTDGEMFNLRNYLNKLQITY